MSHGLLAAVDSPNAERQMTSRHSSRFASRPNRAFWRSEREDRHDHPCWVSLVLLTSVATALALSALGAPSAFASAPSVLSAVCPGPQCPLTSPTPTEQSFSEDVLARINLERAEPARDYVESGHSMSLPPLRSDPELQQTAQSAAEYLARTELLEGYDGPFPGEEDATGENSGGPGYDSAGEDLSVMQSPSHAAAVLSAASDYCRSGSRLRRPGACMGGRTLRRRQFVYGLGRGGSSPGATGI